MLMIFCAVDRKRSGRCGKPRISSECIEYFESGVECMRSIGLRETKYRDESCSLVSTGVVGALPPSRSVLAYCIYDAAKNTNTRNTRSRASVYSALAITLV